MTLVQQIGAALIAAGVSVPAIQKLMTSNNCTCGKNRIGKKGHDSDKKPPEGFAAHAQLILDASSTAPADVQIEYLTQGFSEAETLQQEVERLSNEDDKPKPKKG